MKEIEVKDPINIEVSVKQQKQVEYLFAGSLVPHEGHKVWEINNETLEVDLAKFANVTYVWGGVNKPEILKKKGHTYVCALNKKNALKQFSKGQTGGKVLGTDTITLF